MEGDGLVISDVSPASAFACEELGVEAPGDDGVDDNFVGAVDVEFLWDGEELAVAAGAGSASGGLDFMGNWEFQGGLAYLFRAAFCEESRRRRPESAMETTSCILMSSMFSRVGELRKFLRQKAYSLAPGVLRVRFQAQYALYTVNKSESPAYMLNSG